MGFNGNIWEIYGKYGKYRETMVIYGKYMMYERYPLVN